MLLRLRIENVYDDGTVTVLEDAEVPPPPTDPDEREDWAFEHLYPHTGTGRVLGDAGYFVEIVNSPQDPSLVGLTFEWGI